MGVADTKPAEPVSQTPVHKHLDAPAGEAAEPTQTLQPRVDDEVIGQAIVGGGRGGSGGGGALRERDPVAAGIRTPDQPGWFDKVEAFVSRLSMRDNFWNSVCSLLWLPLAFFSGIRMKELEPGTIAAQAILPFRRFNRNWYRAMAGGALLANSEIAGGTYVFGICGADYTVVCKNLNYTFLRPCFGPAVYRMTTREDVKALVAAGGEFNTTIDMEISQQGFRGERDRRVGKCEATFHVTPKVHHKRKAQRSKRK
jgi:hypothetical protein